MQPSNVISWLAAPRPQRRCGPLELAATLRCLHEAGVRRGYVLVVPTALTAEPMFESRGCDAAVVWWSRLCDAICAETHLSVVVLDAPGGGADALRYQGRVRGTDRARIRVLRDLTRPERSALLELSRAVCTGHRGLLAESGTLGTPSFEPWQLQAALRGDALRDLLREPVAGVVAGATA